MDRSRISRELAKTYVNQITLEHQILCAAECKRRSLT